MKALLLAFLLVAPVQAQKVVNFAWDANPATDAVQGYRFVVDSTISDVGNVTTFSGTFPPGDHVAAVLAYNAVAVSKPSVPVSFTIAPQNDPCVGFTVIVASYTTPLALGSEDGLVMAQAKGSNPVTQMQVLLGSQVTGQIDGTELRFIRGIGFGVPRIAGTYHLFVTATDAKGCHAATTLVRPLVVR